jgi:hypothetical protein
VEPRSMKAGSPKWAMRLGRFLLKHGYRPFAERCSRCRCELPVGQAYYIEGRRLCAACAEQSRKRMMRAAVGFVALSTIAFTLTAVLGVRGVIRGDLNPLMAIAIALVAMLVPVLCLVVGILVMKALNRSAQHFEDSVAAFKIAESDGLLERR